MNYLIKLIFGTLLAFCVENATAKVHQIHLAFGATPLDVVISWSTGSDETLPDVLVGKASPFPSFTRVRGQSRLFTDLGTSLRQQWFHEVKLFNLVPFTTYLYKCGSEAEWSEMYSFRTLAPFANWAPRVALMGDLGVISAEYTVDALRAQRSTYDVLFHLGDIAYNLHSKQGTNGDNYMDMIQPIVAVVPYMVIAGNHEYTYDWLHYRERFLMPNREVTENLYYSFNLGFIHFVLITTELYDPAFYDKKRLSRQYEWLISDLEAATTPAARATRPWIILLTHRTMYCSSKNEFNCLIFPEMMRAGVENVAPVGLELLYMRYGVDIVMAAHTHNYERFFPMYYNEVRVSDYAQPYFNPRAPIHVTNGGAGNGDKNTNFVNPPHEASAFRSTDYGFARLVAQNATHIYLEYFSGSADGGPQVIDSQWIVQHSHGPFRI